MSSGPVPVVRPPALVPSRLFQTRLVNKEGYVEEPIWRAFINTLPKAGQQVTFLQGTHSARVGIPAASYPSGSIYQETDRGVFYIAVRGVWLYAYDLMYTTQDSIPGDLGTNDAGFLVSVTDYAHVLRWNGTAWEWGPGDSGSGRIETFLTAPDASTQGWAKCDGTANVAFLRPDGSLDFTDLPDLTGVAIGGTGGYWFRQ